MTARSEQPAEVDWSRRHLSIRSNEPALKMQRLLVDPEDAQGRIGLAGKQSPVISGCACRITYNAGM